MTNHIYIIVSILVVAAVTWITRALPYLIFGKKKKLNETVDYLGKVLPASIMVILVVYCLKDLNFTLSPFGLPELICVGVVALLQIFKKNMFLSIAAGTVLYMVLIRVM